MPPPTKPQNDLMRYAGLGGQILVSLGLAVFAGFRADRWLKVSFPLLVWLLPLIVVSLMIYKLIKETSRKKDA
jgi:apolipoprotein N-acyltransferase